VSLDVKHDMPHKAWDLWTQELMARHHVLPTNHGRTKIRVVIGKPPATGDKHTSHMIEAKQQSDGRRNKILLCSELESVTHGKSRKYFCFWWHTEQAGRSYCD